MKLLRVRYYSGGTLVSTDEVVRAVLPAAEAP